MNIIIGIISSFFTGVGGSLHKKSIDQSTLSVSLFGLFGPIVGIIIIYGILFFMGFKSAIFSDYTVLILLSIAGIIDGIACTMENVIMKNIKISKILPYNNFDKLFVIVIGFILFYGNPGYTSITTLLVAIFTVFVIVLLSTDIKNIGFEKGVGKYIGVKLLYAIETIIIGKILLDYTTLEVFSFIVFIYLLFHVLVNIILKQKFKLLFTQNKSFYKYRLLSTFFLRLSFILGIFIIELSGVLVASLLSFIAIVFSILSMKFFLGDTPSKKQITLAILVIILIGIGFYFK